MKVLRKPDVSEKVGLSSISIWRLESQGMFPRRIKLGERCVGWLEEDIDNWLASRPHVERGKTCA
jgi:prophage regulatory protein